MDIRSFFQKPSGAPNASVAKNKSKAVAVAREGAVCVCGLVLLPPCCCLTGSVCDFMCGYAAAESPVRAKKPAAKALKAETPTRTTPSRRAKQNVVVLDDSDYDNDDNFEGVGARKKAAGEGAAKPTTERKRLRRAAADHDDDDDDDEEFVVAKPRTTAATRVKKETAAAKKPVVTDSAKAPTAVKTEVKAETQVAFPVALCPSCARPALANAFFVSSVFWLLASRRCR